MTILEDRQPCTCVLGTMAKSCVTKQDIAPLVCVLTLNWCLHPSNKGGQKSISWYVYFL